MILSKYPTIFNEVMAASDDVEFNNMILAAGPIPQTQVGNTQFGINTSAQAPQTFVPNQQSNMFGGQPGTAQEMPFAVPQHQQYQQQGFTPQSQTNQPAPGFNPTQTFGQAPTESQQVQQPQNNEPMTFGGGNDAFKTAMSNL